MGERTHLSCEGRAQGELSLVVVDAYALDAVERKLMFGARKGVTRSVVTWFMQQLDLQLTSSARTRPPEKTVLCS